MEIVNIIAQRLKLNAQQVQRTIKLLNEGATIPFISRYRKEVTGGMDEVEIAAVRNESERLSDIQHRKNTILLTIEEQGKLTDELRQRIETCWDSTVLEDIYLPYKPKRHTRAQKAREKGLEPLADLLLKYPDARTDSLVEPFLSTDVPGEEEALQGARDIIAERVGENEERPRNIGIILIVQNLCLVAVHIGFWRCVVGSRKDFFASVLHHTMKSRP